jgi:hypothetical protein
MREKVLWGGSIIDIVMPASSFKSTIYVALENGVLKLVVVHNSIF